MRSKIADSGVQRSKFRKIDPKRERERERYIYTYKRARVPGPWAQSSSADPSAHAPVVPLGAP